MLTWEQIHQLKVGDYLYNTGVFNNEPLTITEIDKKWIYWEHPQAFDNSRFRKDRIVNNKNYSAKRTIYVCGMLLLISLRKSGISYNWDIEY